jgi:hypothetical protein
VLESLLLVSGLPWTTEGEALLVDTLRARGVRFQLSHLSDHELAQRNGAGHSCVVLLLPILGDNDLSDGVSTCVAHLAACEGYRECAIVVIAHGDRHVSDEFITDDTPFSIKVSRLFSSVGTFEILKTKLDKFTATELAQEILDLVDATSASDVLELNGIARLLPRAAQWDARKRQLNFYDRCTGSSLLKTAERAVQKRIAGHIRVIDPRTLKMTHAGLGDDALADLEGALHAEVIDLGSNAFTLKGLAPQLGCLPVARSGGERPSAGVPLATARRARAPLST